MKKLKKTSIGVHSGSVGDPHFKGLASPIYPSSAYDYEGIAAPRYPRYFNTPNPMSASKKIAALEEAEEGLLFSSGLGAILTTLMSFLQQGSHAIFQHDLYGGSLYAITKELPLYGIAYSLVDIFNLENLKNAIRPNTKIIYIESPSNPTLQIVDISGVAEIAKKAGIKTVIDNTFASPINQNPIQLGIDLVCHSGTKYLGGHSDLCCGVTVGRKDDLEQIKNKGINLGGILDPFSSWLLERSLKTLSLRVRQQNENALEIARFLENDSRIKRVYYPGLSSHPQFELAKKQMPGGFGGMVSFETKQDGAKFIDKLSLIKRAISLGGVESTLTLPIKTSHAKISPEERKKFGITENLIRFSVGIEDAQDLIDDLNQAL